MLLAMLAAAVFFSIHILILLIGYIKKDSNINYNVSVVHGGYRIGSVNDRSRLVIDYRDGMDTIIKTGPNVTSSFGGVSVRLYDMQYGTGHDAYLDKNIQIGRIGSGSDIELSDSRVSAKHCSIYRKGNEIMIQDLGSTNHTYLNGCVLECPMPLTFGDILGIGEHTYQFQFFEVEQ